MFAEAIEHEVRVRGVGVEELIESHFGGVYRYASRRLSREDAEDATLETFQAAIQHLHRLKGKEPYFWLLGIARRKVADRQRKAIRRREEPLGADLLARPAISAEQKEADEVLRQIVMSLPEDQRDALLLQQLEELSVSEIAVVMGRSEKAITGLLYRARASAFQKGKSYFVESEVKR